MAALRTIFLLIRGEYMAGLAVQRARKDIEGLEKAEYNLARQTQQTAYGLIFAGGAFLAFGGMVVTSMMRIMEKYAEGYSIVRRFHREWDRAMGKLAVNIAQNLGPTLIALAKILNIIAQHPIAVQLVFWGALILVLAGAFQFLWGSLVMVISTLGLLFKSQALIALGAKLTGLAVQDTGQKLMSTYFVGTQIAKKGTDSLTFSMHGLAIAIGAALSGFILAVTIVTAVAQVFGKTTGVIVGITIAIIGLAVAIMALKGVLSLGATIAQDVAVFGAALAAGGAISAAYVAATYQKGSSFVRRGGLAVLHGGEEIKSARESTALSKLEKERRGVQAPTYKRSVWHVPITIETVNTRSDREDLQEKIRRALKDVLDNKV